MEVVVDILCVRVVRVICFQRGGIRKSSAERVLLLHNVAGIQTCSIPWTCCWQHHEKRLLFNRNVDEEREESYLLAELVEYTHIGVRVIDVVGVGRILLINPLLRCWNFPIENRMFRFALIVDRIETHQLSINQHSLIHLQCKTLQRCNDRVTYMLEEPVELGVVLRIIGGVEQWQEQIINELLEVADQLVRTVDIAGKEKHQWYEQRSADAADLLTKVAASGPASGCCPSKL